MTRRTIRAALLSVTLAVSASYVHAGQVEQQLESRVTTLAAGTAAATQSEITASVFIPEFYALRSYAPAWFDDTTATALFAELDRGVAQGFRAQDFHIDDLRAAYAKAQSTQNAGDIATYDILASDAVAKLLNYSIFGKVDPAKLDGNWNFERLVLQQNPPQVVNAFLEGDGITALMDQVLLKAPQYNRLMRALAYYRDIASTGGWPQVPDTTTLKPGMVDEAVNALRYRLAGEFALNAGQILPPAPDTGEPASWVYDQNLVADMKVFQARHGLEADGVIGPKTLVALNRSADDRVNQIRLSLERARWIMRDLEDDYVLVNIAGGQTYYAKGDEVWITRSVTGTQYRQTPVFRDNIQYMEINPTWTVPNSIFRKDKLTRIRKDPNYLSRNGYVVKTRDGTVIPASSVDWSASNPPVTLMQKPGDNNALGQIKFMFPNAHSVYLHDTDNRDLFNRNERNLSSGCVRIEYPFEFANLLMEGDPDWSESKLQSILESGQTTRIPLPQPVPVLLTYWTAWVDGDAVQFREDLYDRDAKILDALNK
ncbi:L,D-transpeptidase family protein [Shimia thalassica]|uniref:L,D-transpeptidase family protein n=1 Tax=Shimia thalassica TaxID=1715693 RepID=UPI002732F614|nr:L,D-transpeptidase family protein [Shimia thalassica]MDP2493744.1 L,D-transpeptidase family protein [Shimia thalassica]